MLLALETALERLSDAGKAHRARDQLIAQFEKMANPRAEVVRTTSAAGKSGAYIDQ